MRNNILLTTCEAYTYLGLPNDISDMKLIVGMNGFACLGIEFKSTIWGEHHDRWGSERIF